jgi:hypothetical protein
LVFGPRVSKHGLRVVCNLRLSESDKGSRMPELDEEVNAAKKGRLSTQGVVHLVNEVLREN